MAHSEDWRSETYHQLLFEQARDIIFFTRSDGQILDANSAAGEAYGYSRAEFLVKTLQDLCARPDAGSLISKLAQAGPEGTLYETVHRRQDGSTFPVEVSARGVRSSGQTTLINVVRDITDQKAACRRAAQLQSVLDNTLDSVLVADSAGTLAMANESGLRMLQVTDLEEQPISVDILPDILKPRDLHGHPIPARSIPLSRALRGEEVRSMDMIVAVPSSGRDIHVRANASPIRDSDGVIGAVALYRDVTELTELDRLKDQFVSVAAHELKTPVTVMKGYAQLLLRAEDRVPTSRRRHLEAIDRGSDRIHRVVNDLLDVSQIQLGHLELRLSRFRLDSLVRKAVEAFANQDATHRIVIRSLDPAIVRADDARLKQVMRNLLDNAARYSPSGSEVVVRLDCHGRQVEVTVEDRGIGIPREKQARIASIFYRAHTGTAWDQGGMGAGLFIAREILLRHGGKIWFESREGTGSSFHFTLPMEAPND